MSQLLQTKLAEVRRRDLQVTAGLRIGQAVVAVVVGLGVVMLLDRAVELPMAVRGVVAVMLWGGAAAFLWGTVVRRAMRPPGDEELALRIERDQPGLRQRLISAVQLSRAGGDGGAAAGAGVGAAASGSMSLIQHLIGETEELLAPADLTPVVRSEPMYHWMGGATLAGLLMIIVVGLTAPVGPALLARAMGVPGVEMPRRTRIELLTPSPLTVPKGEDLTLAARAGGAIPEEGQLEVSGGSRRTSRHRVLPTTRAADEFEVMLQNVSEDFTYRFYLGDNRTAEAAVHVSPRPVVERVEFLVTPPAYSGLAAMRKFPGDLSVLSGSTLSLTVRGSKALAANGNTVTFRSEAGVIAKVPLSRTGERTLSAEELAVPAEATGVSVQLVDAEGLASKDSAVYPITVMADRPPAVRMILPSRREDLVTRGASVRIAEELSDDLGLTELNIRYRIHPPPNPPSSAALAPTPISPTPQPSIPPGAASRPGEAGVQTLGVELPARRVSSLRAQHLLDLSTLPLAAGQTLEWWLEVKDSKGQVTASEHFSYRIGTEAEVRSALMGRLGTSLGALEDAQSAQQSLTQDLGQLLLQKPLNPATQPQ